MSGKGVEQLQNEGDKARRKQVDAKNKKDAAKGKADVDKLAKTPLTPSEISFCETVAAKMNCGRQVEAPSAADVLRYSKLRGRLGIEAPEEGE